MGTNVIQLLAYYFLVHAIIILFSLLFLLLSGETVGMVIYICDFISVFVCTHELFFCENKLVH